MEKAIIGVGLAVALYLLGTRTALGRAAVAKLEEKLKPCDCHDPKPAAVSVRPPGPVPSPINEKDELSSTAAARGCA